MTGQIYDHLPLSVGVPVATRNPPTFGERFSAGRTQEITEKNVNDEAGHIEEALIDEIFAELPEGTDDGRLLPIPNISPFQPQQPGTRRVRAKAAFDAIAAARAADPAAYRDLPASFEELERETLRRRQAGYNEARAVADAADPGFDIAGFLGAMSGALTDEVTLATLAAGAPPGLSLGRTIGIEAGIGAVDAARTLPSEYRVADELEGVPDVQPVQSIALGAGLGAAFGGAAKGLEYVLSPRVDPTKPEGVDAFDHAESIEAAAVDLNGPPTAPAPVPPRPAAPTAATPTPAPEVPQAARTWSDDELVGRITGVESGGNPNAANPNSTAVGLGQFIESTWLATIRKHRPDLTEGKTPGQILALRRNPAISREMTVAFTADNRATLRAAGLPDGPGETYLAHFAGPTGAMQVLRAAPETPIAQILSPAAIDANRGIRRNGKRFADFTAFDLRMWAQAKMSGAGNGGGGGSVYVPTSRGYTSSGQVTAGEYTIDVDYEVVDASTLTAASGDLQPRDRSRASSDEQIADIAARLDPARLMPSPEADRGAPIVGPDNVVESGNGRVAAIRRAGETSPDRADAYRRAIEDAGFPVPEGVETPVLVARRRTEMDAPARAGFVRAANTSAIARMSATERSAMDARAVSADALSLYRPDAKLAAAENADFVRAVLDGMPQTERAGLVTEGGRINREGQERIRQAMFARAFDADDIRAAAMEIESPEVAGLVAALDDAAPEWAKLRAAVDSGELRPEMNIGGHVEEAVRLIASARETAAREGGKVANLIDELLADVDLIDGALAPLSAALVRKMAPGGRVAPSARIADFLKRYAAEAQRVGQAADTLFEAPGPLDVLKRIDAETFGDLTETGRPRGQGDGGVGRVDVTGDAPDFAEGAQAPVAQVAAEQMRRDIVPELATPESNANPQRDEVRRELMARADDPAAVLTLGDTTTMTPSQVLDELDRDDVLDSVLDVCPTGRGL